MDREEIINSYDNGQFKDFLIHAVPGKVLELFNDEGLEILNASRLKSERIRYILTYCSDKNELLQNDKFLQIFFSTDIYDYYASLRGLDHKTYDKLLNTCIELGKKDMFASLLSYFDIEYQLSLIDNWSWDMDLLYSFFMVSSPEVKKKIIDNYDLDLTNPKINIFEIFNIGHSSASKDFAIRSSNGPGQIIDFKIPSKMITRDLAQKIWDSYDIFKLRVLINNAMYVTDTTVINDYVKEQEDKIINNSTEEELLSPYKELYDIVVQMHSCNSPDDNNYYDYKMQAFSSLRSIDDDELENLFMDFLSNGNIEPLYEQLKKLSSRKLSNYIIDYHFEENFHNIMVDMQELLRFYYDGHISIPEDRIELYRRIVSIDQLPIAEKIELHNYLKSIDMISVFYDDMAFARKIVAEAIKEQSLTSESIKEYKDEELSEKYGVPVYSMQGEHFFGIVKTHRHQQEQMPTGHSYSLVGSSCTVTFGCPGDVDTYLYDADSMTPEQMVHTYPHDSFTLFKPFEYSRKAPTKRVNALLMPEDLVGLSPSYNELLILEQGYEPTDMDSRIPELRRIALYCIDEITPEAVETAQRQSIGIILINTKKYEQTSDYGNPRDVYSYGLDYFDGYFDAQKFESRR